MITGTRLLVCCFIYRLRYNRLPGDQRLTDRDLVIRYSITWQTPCVNVAQGGI